MEFFGWSSDPLVPVTEQSLETGSEMQLQVTLWEIILDWQRGSSRDSDSYELFENEDISFSNPWLWITPIYLCSLKKLNATPYNIGMRSDGHWHKQNHQIAFGSSVAVWRKIFGHFHSGLSGCPSGWPQSEPTQQTWPLSSIYNRTLLSLKISFIFTRPIGNGAFKEPFLAWVVAC